MYQVLTLLKNPSDMEVLSDANGNFDLYPNITDVSPMKNWVAEELRNFTRSGADFVL